MNPDGFLRDILAAPDRLADELDAYDGRSPLDDLGNPSRVVFVGMGSSRFAAVPAAALLRSRGIDAVAELASTALAAAPSTGTLAVGISASGSTRETIEALARHSGTSRTVAVTNDPGGELALTADVVLPLHAGTEEGGVSCLTFQATLAVLHLLVGRLTGSRPSVQDLRPAVEAASGLRESRREWVDELAGRVAGAGTTYCIAPAERLSSALQSALLLREGPRLPAVATETGDWLHVDVYLSKRPGYTALLFPGSRYDGAVMTYATERRSTIVAAGRAVSGAAQAILIGGSEHRFASLLVETGVAELLAAELWRRGLEAGDAALLP